jgi:hypothetical protein
MHGDGRGRLAKWANPLLRTYSGWPFVVVPGCFKGLLYEKIGLLIERFHDFQKAATQN